MAELMPGINAVGWLIAIALCVRAYLIWREPMNTCQHCGAVIPDGDRVCRFIKCREYGHPTSENTRTPS